MEQNSGLPSKILFHECYVLGRNKMLRTSFDELHKNQYSTIQPGPEWFQVNRDRCKLNDTYSVIVVIISGTESTKSAAKTVIGVT